MVTGGGTLRIAHYAPELWAKGGIATYIERLGNAQSEFGHEVIYLSQKGEPHETETNYALIGDDEELFSECESKGVDILHLHKGISMLPSDSLPTVRTMHGHQGGCPSGTRFLSRPSTPCDRAYSISGCLWGHTVDRCGSVRPGKLLSNFMRIRNEHRLATNIQTVTVSHFLREQMMRAGCEEKDILTIHSPAPDVEVEYQPIPPDGVPRFVYLGRLVPQKGADWLLRALSHVEEKVKLDIAGDGPMLETLKELVREKGLDDRVVFHGWLDDDDVGRLLTSARAVVFPSIWHEPAGLITLEAAAYGRPVIASRVGGIPEYARPEFAALVEPNNDKALAGAINKLARDANEAERRGKTALETVRTHFAMRDFVRRMNNIYRGVIGRAHSPKEH